MTIKSVWSVGNISNNWKMKIKNNFNKLPDLSKKIVWTWFKKMVGTTILASVLVWVSTSINIANAYKEYGNMTTVQAIDTYGAVNSELLQWVKVFWNVDTFNSYWITKNQMLSIDTTISEYVSKTGNYVGVALFWVNSGCNSIQDCKELNMKVKWLSDNWVAILIMDTGKFWKNISVISDPAIKDFFSSSDEKYVIDSIIKPTLKNKTVNDGLIQWVNYITSKLGASSIESQRANKLEQAAIEQKQMAEQAVQDQIKAKEQEKLNAILLAENIKKTEERNKKLKELTITTMKYLLMLFVAIGLGYAGKKWLDRVKISVKKNALFNDLDNLEVTAKVLEAMKKTGDLTQDEYDNALDDMDDIRSKIQNLDFKSIANDKLVLATLAEKTEEMLNMKSNIDTMISEINEGKKGIDGQLTEKIKEYEDKLQDAKSTLSSVKNDGFSNIEDYRNKTSLDINSFVNKIEDIKSKISSNTSVSFIDKKNFLNDIKKYVKSIDSKVDEFITDIQDIKTKASEHEKNKKVIEEIKGEDL